MNQIIYRWLSLVLIIFALTACSSQKSQEITTITLSGWQSSPTERELLEKVLQKFATTHPNLRVEYEAIADQYMDVLKTRLIGEAAPDVFFLDAVEAPLMMSSGSLEPLDRYLTQEEVDLADFVPSLLKAFKYNGSIYGLPKDFSSLALFYNQTFFKAANLTEPPTTWEQLRLLSKKLTIDNNRNGRIERYGLGIAPELARQLFMIKAFGGQLMDRQGNAAFATPQSLKGLELIINQYQQDHSSAQPSDVGAASGSEMFGQEKVAMVIEGTWAIPYLKETFPHLNFNTAEVPVVGDQKGTMAYTVAYVMNKQTKHKQAAWQLISYLTGKEGMKAWAQEGVVLPARQSVLSALRYNHNSVYAPFIAGAAYATLWQANENLPLIINHFNNQFISALLGEQSLKSAMLKAQKAANQEIQASHY